MLVKRPRCQQNQADTHQKQEGPTGRPSKEMSKLLTPRETDAVSQALMAYIFRIPVFMAILACHGGATGGTNARTISMVQTDGGILIALLCGGHTFPANWGTWGCPSVFGRVIEALDTDARPRPTFPQFYLDARRTLRRAGFQQG